MEQSILYIVNIPSPYRVSFFNELGKYCKLTVIFEDYQAMDREKNWHDYNFTNFKGLFLNDNDKKSEFKKRKIVSFLEYNKFDVIVVGNYSTLIGMLAIGYLKTKNHPFVINVDGGLINFEENRLRKYIKTKLISSASAWLSTGAATNMYLEYYGANKEKIYTYPFTTLKDQDIIGATLTADEKKNIRQELKMPYKNIVLAVGRFIHGKGFDILIKGSNKFAENTGVYLVGGKETDEYAKLIKQFKIKNVHFINFMEYENLRKYYMAADVFVLPTRQDVWGLVINEAMANGLPVVTTTSCVAGLEMIEDEVNGYLIPKDNIEQLVEKTNFVLNNLELKKQMSVNNITKAHEYTIENMATVTIKILSKLN